LVNSMPFARLSSAVSFDALRAGISDLLNPAAREWAVALLASEPKDRRDTAAAPREGHARARRGLVGRRAALMDRDSLKSRCAGDDIQGVNPTFSAIIAKPNPGFTSGEENENILRTCAGASARAADSTAGSGVLGCACDCDHWGSVEKE